jgi:hypothetical protein
MRPGNHALHATPVDQGRRRFLVTGLTAAGGLLVGLPAIRLATADSA